MAVPAGLWLMAMNYSIVHDSRIGGREVNQDRVAWLAAGDALVMVVADGMGGHLQGEVAAQLAVDVVIDRFRRASGARIHDPAAFLTEALTDAHRTIVRYAAECSLPSHIAPRTTCIACLVQDGHASWAHAGDSRLYLIHAHGEGAGRVARTRDHSLVQRLLDAGTISHAEAAGHPLRHRVFSCLGGDMPPHIEVSVAVPLRAGDLIALCTDGAWSPLGDRLAAELNLPLTVTVPRLLDVAEAAAGPDSDNLTLIALHWEGDGTDGRKDAEPRTQVGDSELERAVAELRRRNPHVSRGVSS